MNYEIEVKKVYPDAVCKTEGSDRIYLRYGIYSGKNRVDGWSCLSQRNAWKSCHNQITKHPPRGSQLTKG